MLCILALSVIYCGNEKSTMPIEETSTSVSLSEHYQYMGVLAGVKARITASALYYGNRSFEKILAFEFIGSSPEIELIKIQLDTNNSVITRYP